MTTFAAGQLKGKVAFVAGGTSGINLGIAKGFAAQGAKVAVLGRNPEKAAAAAALIDPAGADAIGIAADVRDFAAVDAAFKQTVERFGPIDIVISGAAGNFVAPALSISSNGFKTVVDIDLVGTFHVFRACYDYLQRPGASLIAITAGQATHPHRGQAHVCAAKAGINMLVKCLALEWGADGVRVNGISPGPIDGTEGMARLTPTPEKTATLIAKIPLGRYGRIPEIADMALFLSSESAGYITGTILDCDGGQLLSSAGELG